MTEIKIVSAGKLDKEGLKKIGKSFLICLGAAGIEFLANLTGIADFGSVEVYVATFLPFVVNFLRKWLLPYQTTEN